MPSFVFFKSSYSTGSGECVEVAVNVPNTVAVRDSKVSDGPRLLVTPAGWGSFLAHLTHRPGS
ncbi:DUF397 domain-containing protein [Streptomyces sp. JJ66]|uniref:DUF397 domain-containing protein n=1 Tax=Streptomyces sp. JJ66 TaxID=2803843 RepID=UPI001C559D69|nr:DUF397 domain-containing protein [Streptomyces sp. JJ66]MBW1601573.1 DUF397 domain-containing protein [Streptomyces sp. JJ66]